MASQYVDSTRTTDRRNAAQRARNAVRASRAHEDAGRKHLDLPVQYTVYRYRSGKKTTGEPGAGHTRDTRAHKGTGTGLNILSCDYRDFLCWCGVRVRAVRAARAASSPAAPSLSPPLSSPSLPPPPLSKAHASPDRSAHQGSSLINKVPRIGTRLGRSREIAPHRKIITAPQG
jgi:hypothetical protein